MSRYSTKTRKQDVIATIFFLTYSASQSWAANEDRQTNHQLRISEKSATRPLSARLAPDGGIIFAGSIQGTQSAWAARLNSDGSVAWTYLRPLPPPDPARRIRVRSSPHFADAVPMPDGSTFLCGDMPHQPGETASTALLTHLGKAGTVISEQLIEINGSDAKKTSYSFVSCTRLQEGFVALAYEHHIPGPGEAGISGSSFVLVQFDKNGRATWTRHFEPIEPGFNPATTTVQRLGQSLAVTSTDNNSTEVATFTLEGDVISRKSLALPYVAIRGDEAADQLELFGPATLGGADDTLKHVFTFDSHLRETSRQSGSAPTRFAPNVIYRMPDQSLIFFGSQLKSIEGSMTSGIRHVNKDLTKEETIQVDQEGFSDSGSIWAATPTSNPKQFAVARTFAPSLAARERGAVIDFISLAK